MTYSVTNGTGEATIDENGVLTPVKVGTVKVKATKAGDFDYDDVTSEEKEITITKATPTGEPKYTPITERGKTLADAALAAEGGTFSVSGNVKWIDDDNNGLASSTVVEKNTYYKWLFTPDDANYEAISGSIELYYASGSSNTPKIF